MQYKIQLDVYGGEFIVGSIPNKTINYWLTQEQESLDNHLVFDNQDKVPNPLIEEGAFVNPNKHETLCRESRHHQHRVPVHHKKGVRGRNYHQWI